MMPTTNQPNDVLRRWFDDSMTMLDPWMTAWTNATTTAPPATRKDPHREHDGCTCSAHEHEHEHSCGCHGTGCGCSARDADLVIVARIGERRVVPLVLHNEWRRERPITVGVSAFRPCDPCSEDVEIAVTSRPTGEVVLAPCSRTVIDIIVDLPDLNREKAPLTRCTTVYGDISTDGCARPVRLAVVVLPHECDAHEIDCCGCSC
jgi:hypothetical protein